MDVGANATRARLGGQGLGVDAALARGGGVTTEVGAGVAAEADLALQRGASPRADRWVADKHAEALDMSVPCRHLHLVASRARGGVKTHRLEGGDLAGLGRHVVDEGAALGLGAEAVAELVGRAALGHALEGAIACLEVQVGGPVVGEVLGELARGASGAVRNVARGHGGVEGVTAHDLMDVARRDATRVDKRVQAIDDDLGATETQHGGAGAAGTSLRGRLGERHEGEERGPKHGVLRLPQDSVKEISAREGKAGLGGTAVPEGG